MNASITMVIVCTIATTRRLGSTARVKLGMSCRTIKRVAKVRSWELARVYECKSNRNWKDSCFCCKQRITWSLDHVTCWRYYVLFILDINECEIPGMCSQICHNTKGSFKCSCLDNYVLDPDGRKCRATGMCNKQLGLKTLSLFMFGLLLSLW